MEGITLIEGKELKYFKEQLVNIQQQNLAILKQLQSILPTPKQGNLPDFISIADAVKKYHVSRVTINNKIRLFKETKNREIDRMQSGNYFLINEAELQEAIRIKGSVKF